MRSKGSIEGDGVLQMLRWLDRTPESFVAGHRERSGVSYALRDVGPERILRFDAGALHSALNARRTELGMTWRQVADDIGGIAPAGLTRLARGGRVAFPQVMRVVIWLDRPAASFTQVSDW
jgi:hypothetical protein